MEASQKANHKRVEEGKQQNSGRQTAGELVVIEFQREESGNCHREGYGDEDRRHEPPHLMEFQKIQDLEVMGANSS